MTGKKDVIGSQLRVGSRLLLQVGSIFKRETIEAIVKEVSPNGEYVRFGDTVEWFKITSLKIIDIFKAA